MKQKLILFIVLFCSTIAIAWTSVITTKPIECECYNATAPEQCKENRMQCETTDPDKSNYCFVLWSSDKEGTIKVSMKGCFTNNAVCNQTECIDYSMEAKKTFNFCCCKGNMCNKQHKWLPTTTKSPAIEKSSPAPPPEEPTEKIVLIIVVCCLLTFTLIGSFVGIFVYRNRKTAMFNEIPTNEPDISSSSLTLNNPRPIQLIQMMARGRFGAVWRAQLRQDEIAVKRFPMQDKSSWQTEQDIYKLPRMKHENILEFIGVEKHTDPPELWLITMYHPHGSLCDYLKANTITWDELCRIAETMARGLTHLHEEIAASKGDGLKPAIAHRDFKSKNVLLKADLTACIADLGLALVFEPGKPCGDTHGQVGTRRYMAPEVLEGAINFTRDAFLRIDVYACGLVLWELVSRCTGHSDTVKDFTLPFETELGPHPTIEEMQENVVMRKLRPHINEHWRLHSGLSAICDTMEECWDHDAEARLSSSCVMERISQKRKYPCTPLIIETNTDTSIKNHHVDSI